MFSCFFTSIFFFSFNENSLRKNIIEFLAKTPLWELANYEVNIWIIFFCMHEKCFFFSRSNKSHLLLVTYNVDYFHWSFCWFLCPNNCELLKSTPNVVILRSHTLCHVNISLSIQTHTHTHLFALSLLLLIFILVKCFFIHIFTTKNTRCAQLCCNGLLLLFMNINNTFRL